MKTNLLLAIIFLISLTSAAFSQRPGPGMGGPPPGDGPRKGDWTKGLDANQNRTIEADEFQAAIDRTFADLNANDDGVIDRSEIPDHRPPLGPGGPPPPDRGRPGESGQLRDKLPPFFFMHKFRDADSLTKAELERAAKEVFAEMDTNDDGVLSREESRPPKDRGGVIEERIGPPPNAMFVAAELRFGDKLVKGQPFSAEIVIEDTKRLYDGSTVTKTTKGAFYRDSAGRTRREQPFEMVGGFTIGKPQTLVFINDFAQKTQYFFDLDNKIARKIGIGTNVPPRDDPQRPDAKSDSLGTKTIEGISVEGTRITYELPAGRIGNEKPIQVITENWYSPELQVIVMSRHLDPLSGEHIFRLVNVRRAEPAANLFTVPAGFEVKSSPGRPPRPR